MGKFAGSLAKILGVVLAAVLLLSWFPFETRSASADQTQFFYLLNDLFQKMGGSHSLVMDERLNQSTTNHANYMALNQVFSHYEEAGKPGFTGVTPVDRARYVGFEPYGGSPEDITGGNESPFQALDDWLWSLPHRWLLLSNCKTYVGFGNNKSSFPSSVVQTSCAPSYEPAKVITKYPYPGQTGVPVAMGQNGYVTSITFDYNHSISSVSFKDGKGTDIPFSWNDLCGPSCTLTPTNPLQYGETYTINIKGTWEMAEDFDVSWSFTTENRDFSLLKVSENNTISQGSKATYNLAVNPVNTPTFPVNLSVSGLPIGVTASFSANNRVPYFDTILSVQTASNSPPGTYPFKVIGTGGGKTHELDLDLIIKEKVNLSISATPTVIIYPSATTLSGILTNVSNVPLAAKNVTIQAKSGTSWVNVATVQTNGEGQWSYSVKPSRNVYYRATYTGDSTYGSVISNSQLIKVKPYVGISAAYPRIRVGRSDLMKFSTNPKHVGYYISIQKKSGTSWITIARVKLDSNGYGRYYFRTSRRGTYYLRAVLPKHSDNETGISRYITVKVY